MRVSERHAYSKYPFRAARSKFWLILRGAKFFLQKNFVSQHVKNRCNNVDKLPKNRITCFVYGNFPRLLLHIKCTITNSCLVFQCRLNILILQQAIYFSCILVRVTFLIFMPIYKGVVSLAMARHLSKASIVLRT